MKPKTVGRSDGGLAIFPPVDTCGLLADSIILTLDGERRVTDLRVGDRVITRDSGTAVLRGITRHRVRRVDGEFVTLEAAQEMTIFSLDFATPHILYVDGLELASNADMRLDARAA